MYLKTTKTLLIILLTTLIANLLVIINNCYASIELVGVIADGGNRSYLSAKESHGPDIGTPMDNCSKLPGVYDITLAVIDYTSKSSIDITWNSSNYTYCSSGSEKSSQTFFSNDNKCSACTENNTYTEPINCTTNAVGAVWILSTGTYISTSERNVDPAILICPVSQKFVTKYTTTDEGRFAVKLSDERIKKGQIVMEGKLTLMDSLPPNPDQYFVNEYRLKDIMQSYLYHYEFNNYYEWSGDVRWIIPFDNPPNGRISFVPSVVKGYGLY